MAISWAIVFVDATSCRSGACGPAEGASHSATGSASSTPRRCSRNGNSDPLVACVLLVQPQLQVIVCHRRPAIVHDERSTHAPHLRLAEPPRHLRPDDTQLTPPLAGH